MNERLKRIIEAHDNPKLKATLSAELEVSKERFLDAGVDYSEWWFSQDSSSGVSIQKDNLSPSYMLGKQIASTIGNEVDVTIFVRRDDTSDFAKVQMEVLKQTNLITSDVKIVLASDDDLFAAIKEQADLGGELVFIGFRDSLSYISNSQTRRSANIDEQLIHVLSASNAESSSVKVSDNLSLHNQKSDGTNTTSRLFTEMLLAISEELLPLEDSHIANRKIEDAFKASMVGSGPVEFAKIGGNKKDYISLSELDRVFSSLRASSWIDNLEVDASVRRLVEDFVSEPTVMLGDIAKLKAAKMALVAMHKGWFESAGQSVAMQILNRGSEVVAGDTGDFNSMLSEIRAICLAMSARSTKDKYSEDFISSVVQTSKEIQSISSSIDSQILASKALKVNDLSQEAQVRLVRYNQSAARIFGVRHLQWVAKSEFSESFIIDSVDKDTGFFSLSVPRHIESLNIDELSLPNGRVVAISENSYSIVRNDDSRVVGVGEVSKEIADAISRETVKIKPLDLVVDWGSAELLANAIMPVAAMNTDRLTKIGFIVGGDTDVTCTMNDGRTVDVTLADSISIIDEMSYASLVYERGGYADGGGRGYVSLQPSELISLHKGGVVAARVSHHLGGSFEKEFIYSGVGELEVLTLKDRSDRSDEITNNIDTLAEMSKTGWIKRGVPQEELLSLNGVNHSPYVLNCNVDMVLSAIDSMGEGSAYWSVDTEGPIDGDLYNFGASIYKVKDGVGEVVGVDQLGKSLAGRFVKVNDGDELISSDEFDDLDLSVVYEKGGDFYCADKEAVVDNVRFNGDGTALINREITLDYLSVLIKPENFVGMSSFMTNLTAITSENIERFGMPIEECREIVSKEVSRYTANAFAFHNSDFDVSMLQRADRGLAEILDRDNSFVIDSLRSVRSNNPHVKKEDYFALKEGKRVSVLFSDKPKVLEFLKSASDGESLNCDRGSIHMVQDKKKGILKVRLKQGSASIYLKGFDENDRSDSSLNDLIVSESAALYPTIQYKLRSKLHFEGKVELKSFLSNSKSGDTLASLSGGYILNDGGDIYAVPNSTSSLSYKVGKVGAVPLQMTEVKAFSSSMESMISRVKVNELIRGAFPISAETFTSHSKDTLPYKKAFIENYNHNESLSTNIRNFNKEWPKATNIDFESTYNSYLACNQVRVRALSEMNSIVSNINSDSRNIFSTDFVTKVSKVLRSYSEKVHGVDIMQEKQSHNIIDFRNSDVTVEAAMTAATLKGAVPNQYNAAEAGIRANANLLYNVGVAQAELSLSLSSQKVCNPNTVKYQDSEEIRLRVRPWVDQKGVDPIVTLPNTSEVSSKINEIADSVRTILSIDGAVADDDLPWVATESIFGELERLKEKELVKLNSIGVLPKIATRDNQKMLMSSIKVGIESGLKGALSVDASNETEADVLKELCKQADRLVDKINQGLTYEGSEAYNTTFYDNLKLTALDSSDVLALDNKRAMEVPPSELFDLARKFVAMKIEDCLNMSFGNDFANKVSSVTEESVPDHKVRNRMLSAPTVK